MKSMDLIELIDCKNNMKMIIESSINDLVKTHVFVCASAGSAPKRAPKFASVRKVQKKKSIALIPSARNMYDNESV